MRTEFVKTYRYRLMLTPKQLAQLREFAGCCRYVYNRAVAELHVDDAPERVSYSALCKWLTELKHSTEVLWLSNAPSQSLQQALKDLTQSCRKVVDERRRGREAHVRFRSRFDGLGSVRFPQNIRLAEVWGTSKLRTFVVLPKLGAVEYRRSRTIPKGAAITQATVREECGRWYVSLVVRETPEVPDMSGDTSMAGLDLGVRHFAVSYDGADSVFYDIPAPVKKKLRRLDRHIRRLQSIRSAKMERKAFGSAYRKLCMRIRKLWLKVRRIRLDFLHKLTSRIAESQRHAAVEALEIRRITRFEGARKRDLNRSILEQGWYLFRTLLRYKLERRGRCLIEVNPAFTSVTCPICGDRSKSNRDGERFHCTVCGHEDHADANASRNIWAAGQAVLRGTIPAPAGLFLL